MPHSLLQFHDSVFGNPSIHPDSFVSPSADVVGQVIIEKLVLVCANSSLRADEEGPFRICKGSNLQDNSILHGHKGMHKHFKGEMVSIGIDEGTTVAHRTTIHGPFTIGKNVFIGGNALLWEGEIGNWSYVDAKTNIKNGARVGSNCYVGVNSSILNDVDLGDDRYVPPHVVIEKQKHVLERTHEIFPDFIKAKRKQNTDIVTINHDLVERHKKRAIIMNLEREKQQLMRLVRRLSLIESLQGDKQLSIRDLLGHLMSLPEEEFLALLNDELQIVA